MTFFTTPELLEIGNVPFPPRARSPRAPKPWSTTVASRITTSSDVRQYETVESISGARRRLPRPRHPTASREPRPTPHASSSFPPLLRPCPTTSTSGRGPPESLSLLQRSAPVLRAGRAGDRRQELRGPLQRSTCGGHGARVTLIHRGAALHRHIKYWIKPDIENRIKNGEVTAFFETTCTDIREDSVTLRTPEGETTIANNFVFALTGYHPDFAFIERSACAWTQRTPAARYATATHWNPTFPASTSRA